MHGKSIRYVESAEYIGLMKNMYAHIKNKVRESFINHLGKKDIHVLIGVSGGPDSMLLAHALKDIGIPFSIAHMNYGLRGKESEEDEKFVKQFAKKHKIPFYLEKVKSEVFKKNKTGIQETARKLRYDFFNRVMKEHELNYLITAHHAGDQVETVLMNLFRGCGTNGLTGMEVLKGNLFRPMLEISKAEIEQAIKEQKISYRTDSSNLKSEYTRNYLRNEVIPVIKKKWPGIEKTMQHNIELFKAASSNIQRIDNDVHSFDKPFTLDLAQLSKEMLYSFMKKAVEHGFGSKALLDFLKKKNVVASKQLHGKNGILERKGTNLLYSPLYVDQPVLQSAKNTLNIKGVETSFMRSTAETIDPDKIKGLPRLKKWEPGDKMIPLGMKGNKKISDLLTDLKLSVNQKKKVWLLVDDEKPLWLVGFRIDERVKLDKQKGKIKQLRLQVL